MTLETWIPIAGYEDLYEVSNMGHVRSIDRVIINRNGVTRNLRGVTLKPKTVRFGY